MLDKLSPQYTAIPTAPLLVAALALLQGHCPRNELNAALLLHRAALSSTLSPAEREVCQHLAEALER